MKHCDDDTLALLALGERPSPADAVHLNECGQCRAEVMSFGRIVAAGRGDRSAAAVVPPPPHVWDGIAAATAVMVRPRNADSGPPDAPSAPGGPSAPTGRPEPFSVLPGGQGRRSESSVAQPRRSPSKISRLGRWPMLAVAACALLIGGVAGSFSTLLVDRDGSQPAPVIVAQAALDPLPLDPTASGRAVVVRSDGDRVLKVDVSKLTRTDGFYEVWLIDASVKKMVPIGVLSGRTGEFTIPNGLDLGQYPVVDISAEPLDGNPKHSGKSLLRGTIPG